MGIYYTLFNQSSLPDPATNHISFFLCNVGFIVLGHRFGYNDPLHYFIF
jgi:hypothetical protein